MYVVGEVLISRNSLKVFFPNKRPESRNSQTNLVGEKLLFVHILMNQFSCGLLRPQCNQLLFHTTYADGNFLVLPY